MRIWLGLAILGCAMPLAAQCPPTVADARKFVDGFKRTSKVAPGPDGEGFESYAAKADAAVQVFGAKASDLAVITFKGEIARVDITMPGKPGDYAAAFGTAYPATGAAQCVAGKASCRFGAPQPVAGALVKATLGTDPYEPGAHLVCTYDKRKYSS